MALQVWCPLLGTNNQQGLSNVTLNTPGSTMSVSTSGKLGKTYDNSSLTAGGFITNTTINLGSAQSMFCWFRFTSLTSDSSLGCGLMSQHRYQKNQGLGLTIKYVSSTTGYISVNTGTGSSRTFNTYCGSTLLQANTWYHGGFTYDGTNIIKLYINGVCDGTHEVGQMSTPADYIILYCWSFSGSTGTTVLPKYVLKGAMNDARVYNHCLSQDEVSEIAKGLVVNYPLSLPQNNLLKNSNFLQGTGGLEGYTANYATLTKQTDCMKVVSSASNGGFYTNNFDAITTGDMTTFSAYVKADASMTIYIGTDGGGTSNCQSYTIGTTWKQISISKEKTTNNANLRIYGYGTFYAKLLKYELGTRITPWIPNSADTAYPQLGLNNSLEYDVSGYNYHGTKNGTITYSSNTPRYCAGTYFNADGNYISREETSADVRSVSFWVNFPIAVSSTYRVAFADSVSKLAFGMINATTACCTCAGNNMKTFSVPQFTVNTWYHIVVQYNADKSDVTLYINGSAKTSRGSNDSWNHTTSTLMVGRRSTGSTINAYMSDFRMYATVLTAEDIAELYNTSTSISNT